MQQIFDANPQLQEQFPGGLAQFAQLAAQLPELFEEAIFGGLHAGDVVPGAFPEEEQDEPVEPDHEEAAEIDLEPASDLDGGEEAEQNQDVESEDHGNIAVRIFSSS